MRVLSFHAVRKTYRAGVPGCLACAEALRGVDLEVMRGEVLGIAGGRGAGKTTLLLCAAGLVRPDSGAITWFGADRLPAAERASVAFVPELPAYYSFLTVREVLRRQPLAQTPHHSSGGLDAAELVEALELKAHWRERVVCLARPLVQRVAIAEALLRGARLLLLDDVDSALTSSMQQSGHDLVCALLRWGVTTMAATRNEGALAAHFSRVATLVNGRVSGARPRALDVPSLDSGGREPARVAERS